VSGILEEISLINDFPGVSHPDALSGLGRAI
jgi:hypothetical protein